jgi:hypothetical protein
MVGKVVVEAIEEVALLVNLGLGNRLGDSLSRWILKVLIPTLSLGVCNMGL